MLENFLSFLHKNPHWNIPIALVYYLLVVLPHEQVGRVVAWVFDGNMTRDSYNALIMAMSVAGLLGYAYLLIKNTGGKAALRGLIVFYLAVTVLLAALCFKLLIVINIEVVHFVQYGAMAILIFPMVKRYGETVFWCTLLGAADEAWQYFYLAPTRTNYYDFNDVIINLLGSVFGLLLVKAAQPVFARPLRWEFWRSPAFYTSLGLGLLLVGLLQLGWLQVNAPANGQGALWTLIRVPQEGFWTTVHPNVTFHVVQPVEGLVLIGMLLLFYAGLGRQVSNART